MRINVDSNFVCDPEEVDAVPLLSCAERQQFSHFSMGRFLPRGLQINAVSLYVHCEWSASLNKTLTL